MKSRLQRKVILTIALVTGVAVFAVISLPLWWPWVFRPLSERYGLTFAGYERKGYSRFALSHVGFTNRSVAFSSDQVQGLLPAAWVWQKFAGSDTDYLRMVNWQLQISARKKVQGQQSASLYTKFQRVADAVERLRAWMPRAEFAEGVVLVGGQSIRVPEANWNGGELAAHVTLPELQHSGRVRAKIDACGGQLWLASKTLDLDLTTHISSGASGLQLSATNHWLSNLIWASAKFGREGVLPEEAELHADQFAIPGRTLGMHHFDDVSGSLSLIWQTNQYSLNVEVTADALQTNIPPINVVLVASGDLESAFIEKANIQTPGIRAELTRATRINFTQPFLTEEAVLKFAADLGEQALFPAHGSIVGEARLTPGSGRVPPTALVISGEDIGIAGIPIEMLGLSGAFAWPWLNVTKCVVNLTNQSQATLSGAYNFETRSVDRAVISLQGLFGQERLPNGIAYRSATVTANLDGPLDNLHHSGNATVEGVQVPWMRPLQMSVNWRGEQLIADYLRFDLTGEPGSALQLEGSIDLSREEKMIRVNHMALRVEEEVKLELEQPFELALRFIFPGTWALQTQPLIWRGTGGNIQFDADVKWPQRGRVTASLGGLNSQLASGFGDLALPEASLESLKLSAGWSNSPVRWRLEAEGLSVETGGRLFSGSVAAKGDAEGATLEEIVLSSEGRPVATASGFLPVTVEPMTGREFIKVNREAGVALGINVESEGGLWGEFAEWTGVNLHSPTLDAQVTGTWSRPQGRIQLDVGTAKISGLEHEAPAIENVSIDIQVRPELVELKSLTFSVADQPGRISGQIPLGERFWADLPKTVRQPDWGKASARVQLEEVKVAALAPFVCDLLIPQGTLEADILLKPGGELGGFLKVAGIGTRPLASSGAIRDVGAVCRFEDRLMLVESTAVIGGKLVAASGQVDLSGEKWLRGETAPPFYVRITGSNVPLVRRIEAIVRADLNVVLTNMPGQPASVSGTVRLGDSFYLQDLKALAPGGVAAPQRRPPYFSIDQDPFSNWRLNLAVTGDRFMKARTPLFSGIVSANLRLAGTMQDPIATGDVQIDSGTVRLPFANLNVTQGFVTLSSDNPYRPRLFVTASGRVFDYEVKMVVTGSASEPIIEFSSTPPLTSEQTLLMLTAGEVPRAGFSVTSQERAQKMALFLGRSVLSNLGLVGEANRLTIRSGEAVSETGQPTYSVEYQLTEDWSVFGEYDRFNDVNVMLKWRVYSK